jgi:starch-binding outer membrane protein, SusD/RagB family
MRHTIRAAFGAALLTLVAAACDGYLTGPGLTLNPNSPVSGTKEQFYAGVVAAQFPQQEGLLARIAGMYVQHFAGTAGTHRTLGAYTVGERDIDSYFTKVYTGGGLVDVRRVEEMSKAEGDSTFAGVAMFWEAFIVGSAASLWGDIPYSDALTSSSTAALDPQEQVYRGVIAKLDSAIAWIPKTGGANKGPLAVDLIYGGDRAKYVRAANTLEARYLMHWVEAQLAGGASATAAQVACGGDCVAAARAAAESGITSSADDFTTYHSATSGEFNLWYQFLAVNRVGDVGAGRALVDTLKARRAAGDQRVLALFDSVAVGATYDFRGADQNGTGTPVSSLAAARLAPGFRQPLITAAENELLLAEAEYRLGNPAAALTALNAGKARQADRLGVPVPGVASLTGTALVQEIKLEEWIATFQTIEAWNGYKRNCYPRLAPSGTATDVPGRLVYGEAERNANALIPPVAEQPARNRNDPKACSDPTHPM